MKEMSEAIAAFGDEPTWLSNWQCVGLLRSVLLFDDVSTSEKEAGPASQSTRSAGAYDPFRRVFLPSSKTDASSLSVGQHPANPFARAK